MSKHTRKGASGLLFVLCSLIGCTGYTQDAKNAPMNTAQSTTAGTSKEQVLAFLRNLKKAGDAGVVGDPEAFRAITGFEVLTYYPPTDFYKFRRSETYRFHGIPALQPDSDVRFNSYYTPQQGDDQLGSFSIGDFAKSICITHSEVVGIFGDHPIKVTQNPIPTHSIVGYMPGGRWNLVSRVPISQSPYWYSFSYTSHNVADPKPVCLSSVSVGSGPIHNKFFPK